MCPPEVEEQIEKLGPRVSKIYFDAKDEMISTSDSKSERFHAASRIVKAFWKAVNTKLKAPNG